MVVRRDARRGTWYFVVDVGGVAGRRQQVHRRGFPTKKAAAEAEADVVANARRGSYVRPTRETVGAYLVERWLPARRADLRPSTLLGYAKVISRPILPYLGDVPLSALDAATLERFYAQLLASGGRSGKPLSPKTVANTAGVLSIALSDAVRLKVLSHSPATSARLPRRQQPEMQAWSEDEASAFLAAMADDRLYPLWRVALTTGLRRGELAGLRWSDVDMTGGSLTVASTRVVAEGVVTGEPKTRAGCRVVALDRETLSALSAWRRRLAAERLAAGPGWQDVGLVFVDELGLPPHPETITRWWREAVDRAGLARIRLHDARHTAATMLLRAGVPVKVVAQRLGHADVAVTMRIYQHVTAQDDRSAADVLGRALSLDR
jgi:integrase